MRESLVIAVVATGLVSGAAYAQTAPAAPNSANWLTQEKPGQWRATKLKVWMSTTMPTTRSGILTRFLWIRAVRSRRS
jgi:hypothetical protein